MSYGWFYQLHLVLTKHQIRKYEINKHKVVRHNTEQKNWIFIDEDKHQVNIKIELLLFVWIIKVFIILNSRKSSWDSRCIDGK